MSDKWYAVRSLDALKPDAIYTVFDGEPVDAARYATLQRELTMTTQYTEDASGITLLIDEQPDEQPAPSYDVSLDDCEVDGLAITSAQMAKDFLQSGRTLLCVCGPLHVLAAADENPGVSDCALWIWSTATSYSIDHDCKNITILLDQMQTFGYLADGSWSVYCPREE